MAKVLAADDDATIRRLLEINLEMEGYEVALAANGEEALSLARSFEPDLLLLDVMMPRMDGWQVCQTLRSEEAFANVPIVFLSARASGDDVQISAEAGASAYIAKPFDPIELLELVGRLIDDAGARGGQPSRA